jgi:hypothetical protein
MKTKSTLLSLASMLLVVTVFANDGKYIETMQKTIQAVYTAQDVAQLQTAVNTFERIGVAEKNKWEPFYYASFGYIMMAAKEPDLKKKDSYLDLADELLKKAKVIVAKESEVVALDGFIQMLRINVDPAARGQQYSGMSMQSLGTAMGLNPDNPRALALMSQMQFGTAQFFKSSTAEACATAAKAAEKFISFKSDNPLAPQWGKEMNEGMLRQCK